MRVLLAEDLILLAYCNETGAPQQSTDESFDYRLVGALLVELVTLHRVELTAENSVDGAGKKIKKGRVVVRGLGSAGHPELDEALAKIAEKPRKPQELPGLLSRGLRQRLLTGLAERGILREEKSKVLRLFPITRWPAEDSAHENALIERLKAVLLDGAEPDMRERSIIGLAKGWWLIRNLVPKDRRKAAEARAEEIRESEWAGEAVEKAISAAEAVMIAVLMPTIMVSVVSSSSYSSYSGAGC